MLITTVMSLRVPTGRSNLPNKNRLLRVRNPRNDEQPITKEDIFHYVYAVLHNPAYRKKYELNLKREFPRIPFYKDFWQWAKWGKQLMDLHINYEDAKPYPLKVIASETKKEHKKNKKKCSQRLKSRKFFMHINQR